MPHDADAVRRFVAMANFYRKFFPKFSELSIPLNLLTKQNSTFNWTPQCQSAFDKIKSALISPKTLAYPDFNSEFVLTVDASKLGCGAVLAQNNKPTRYSRIHRNERHASGSSETSIILAPLFYYEFDNGSKKYFFSKKELGQWIADHPEFDKNRLVYLKGNNMLPQDFPHGHDSPFLRRIKANEDQINTCQVAPKRLCQCSSNG